MNMIIYLLITYPLASQVELIIQWNFPINLNTR